MVVKAVRLDRKWRTKGQRKVARKAELRLDAGDPTGRVDPCLLPGGKDVLVENQGSLEFWSLETGERMWTASEDEDCFAFDCEVTDAGETLNIAGMFATSFQPDM